MSPEDISAKRRNGGGDDPVRVPVRRSRPGTAALNAPLIPPIRNIYRNPRAKGARLRTFSFSPDR